MVKGRNTTLLGIRLPDKVYEELQRRAGRKGMPIGSYARWYLEQVIKVKGDDSHGRSSSV